MSITSDSDIFFDIHADFFDMYKEGMTAHEVYQSIRTEWMQDLDDAGECDDGDSSFAHEVCFALAHCLWECGCKDDALWSSVRDIIESGANLKCGYTDDPKALMRRERELQKFWQKINTPAKRVRQPRKDRPPRQPTLHKGDLYAYKCGEGYRAALVLDFIDDVFLTAISEEVFASVPSADEAMAARSRTVTWFSARASIPKKQRIPLAALDIQASYNNRAGLICTDRIAGCSSLGERPFFFDIDAANDMMHRNSIGRYALSELLDPDVLPKYHSGMK